MARTRTLANLRTDVRSKADVEGATTRHPNTRVDRWINQGIAALRDLMIEVRGRPYFRKNPPATITTIEGTTRYALPADFYQLISVRDSELGEFMVDFNVSNEAILRMPNIGRSVPTAYELQPGYIELLPSPGGGRDIILDYIPVMTDLVADGDTLDGYQGWEDYVVAFAAREIGIKDDEKGLVKACEDDMAMLTARIRKLAPKRDQFRPQRVRNTRGMRGGWPIR